MAFATTVIAVIMVVVVTVTVVVVVALVVAMVIVAVDVAVMVSVVVVLRLYARRRSEAGANPRLCPIADGEATRDRRPRSRQVRWAAVAQ